MRVEGQHQGLTLQFLGTLEDSGENGPVTQVNPIEIPHSNHGAGKRLMTRGQAMVTHHFPHVRLRE
ncbi:MAG: hypothetical protein P8X49_06515 [Syntrophobacterales bacterium]